MACRQTPTTPVQLATTSATDKSLMQLHMTARTVETPLAKIRLPADRHADAVSLQPGTTHSSRKFPATYARNKGCNPDEVEIRGRWKKNGGRVVFRYMDVAELYEDAKVATALCVGGPVKYALKDGIDIGNEWLFENVLPNICKKIRNDTRLCCVLALPKHSKALYRF